MRRSLLCAAAVAAAGLAASAGSLQAQGSAVQTHSSCATAMGASGVAAPCDDGSAVLFNPAGLALHSSVVGIGWTGINLGGSFQYDEAYGGEEIVRESKTSSVPFGFLSWRFNERLAAGIGVFNPYGLHIFWPVCAASNPRCGETNFEGRFISYDTNLRNIYIQPTVSFALSPMFSIGAGLDIVRSSLELNQRIDLATTALPLPGAPAGTTGGSLGIPFGTDFADVKLTGDGNAFTFHVGAIARLSPAISLGARYMHGVDVEFDGDADFTAVPTGLTLPAGNPVTRGPQIGVDAVLTQFGVFTNLLADQEVKTSLPVPSQLVLGVALTPTPSLKLQADYQRTGWGSWDEAVIDFQGNAPDATLVLDYQDTNTYRLGGEFGATDAITLRAGFVYNDAAQKEFSVSALLPEAERNYYSLGLGYGFSESLQVDLGYQLVDQSDRRGRVRGRPVGATDAQLEALNVGLFTADAHVFNVTLSYRFGAGR